MSQFINFFIKKSTSEEEILSVLNSEIPEGAGSLDYPQEKSAVFLQYLDYDAEFQQSAGLSWASDKLEIDDIRLAQRLADRFSTEVLLEPQHLHLPNGYEWCLVKPDQQIYAVATIELDDGIGIRQGAPWIQLHT